MRGHNICFYADKEKLSLNITKYSLLSRVLEVQQKQTLTILCMCKLLFFSLFKCMSSGMIIIHLDRERCSIWDTFTYFSIKIHVVTPHWNCLNEAAIMTDQNAKFLTWRIIRNDARIIILTAPKILYGCFSHGTNALSLICNARSNLLEIFISDRLTHS